MIWKKIFPHFIIDDLCIDFQSCFMIYCFDDWLKDSWDDLTIFGTKTRFDGLHDALLIIHIFLQRKPYDYDKSVIGQKDWYSRFKDDGYEKIKKYDNCLVKPCHENWMSYDNTLLLVGLAPDH